MKRIFNSLSRRSSSSPTLDNNPSYPEDSPEGIILREVTAFCESGGGPHSSQGNEFVHLPAIVENAESSPNAAKEASVRIRRYLADPSSPQSYVHYNAIMLIRILVDNPGHTFTRNLDAKFVGTVKDLLRKGTDLNVQHFLRETLDTLETQRAWDEDLAQLIQMWRKEKAKMGHSLARGNHRWPQSPPQQAQGSSQQRDNYFSRSHRASPSLPPPDELAARIAEARSSAKLLLQLVQSTPPAELGGHELIKEFSDRCRAASRSVQNYIDCTDPAPDEDTMLTLIETNDELSVAQSKYQHAMLKARKAMGNPANSNTNSPSPAPSAEMPIVSGAVQQRPVPPVPNVALPPTAPPPPVPPPLRNETQSPVSPIQPSVSASFSSPSTAASNGHHHQPYQYDSAAFQVPNPFADHYTTTTGGVADLSRTGTTTTDGVEQLRNDGGYVYQNRPQ